MVFFTTLRNFPLVPEGAPALLGALLRRLSIFRLSLSSLFPSFIFLKSFSSWSNVARYLLPSYMNGFRTFLPSLSSMGVASVALIVCTNLLRYRGKSLLTAAVLTSSLVRFRFKGYKTEEDE